MSSATPIEIPANSALAPIETVDLKPKEKELVQATAKSEAERRIQEEVNARIQEGETIASQLCQKYVSEETKQNYDACQEALGKVAIYKSPIYYNNYYAEHFEAIYQEELSKAEKELLQNKYERREGMQDADLDMWAFSVGMDTWEGTPAFDRVVRVKVQKNNFSDEFVNEFFKGGWYAQLWAATHAPAKSLELDPLEGRPLFEFPVGGTLGAFFRMGAPLSNSDPKIYPSLESGVGIDPFRTVGGAVVGTIAFPVIGTFIGGVNSFVMGLEAYLDMGLNIGPFGVRGGFYPSMITIRNAQEYADNYMDPPTWQLVNPGARVEATF